MHLRLRERKMGVPRRGEKSAPPFRSQRLYCANGNWYFDTREGVQHGPYQEENEAKVALSGFIAQCLHKLDKESISCDDGLTHMVEEFLNYLNLKSKHGHDAALAWANNHIAELAGMKHNSSKVSEKIKTLQYAIKNEFLV